LCFVARGVSDEEVNIRQRIGCFGIRVIE
jgi:hypothetical protein